jgi:hypothetical protein
VSYIVPARAELIREFVAESPELRIQSFERFAMSYPVFKLAFR